MFKFEKQISKFISYVYLIIVLLMIAFFDSYTQSYKNILGIVLMIISISALLKYRNDKYFLLLFGIILYSNITIAVSDCFSNATITLPSNTLSWQNLRGTYSEIIYLKALNLFLAIINIFGEYDDVSLKEERTIENKDNSVVFVFGLILLVYGLITGYGTSIVNMTGYVSNTSSLFEYCLLFFLLTWFYAGSSTIRNGILFIYAIIYVLTAVLHGDRSSAFPMITLLVIIYRKKITLKQILIYAFIGIFASNIIAVYRNSLSFANLWGLFTSNYGMKRIYSDTVSHAFYTGVSITHVRDMLKGTYKYFADFLIGVFAGGEYGAADVTGFCRNYSMNKGGGMCPANFYFWFGYAGVAALGIFIGWFNKKVRFRYSDFGLIIKIYYCVSVFRWYIYTSFDLFRGVFFVLPVAYFVFKGIDNFTHQNFTITIKKRN